MKILHSSDLHSEFSKLFDFQDFDIWVDTGDFFPNHTRGNRVTEPKYQSHWFRSKNVGEQIAKWLAGRPVVLVQGNHDFTDLATLLRQEGIDAQDVSHGPVEVHDHVFAGFREIPWIAGEWNGEVMEADISHIVRRTLDSEADILLTHCPPAGILADRWGSNALLHHLVYTKHSVKLHLFGHIHVCGGQEVEDEDMGVRFVNGARHIGIVESAQ